MGAVAGEQDSWVLSRNLFQEQEAESQTQTNVDDGDDFYQETEEVWAKMNQNYNNNSSSNKSKNLLRRTKSKKKKNQVLLEGYVGATNNEDDLKRTKSLTDEDLDELKGCVDLGFGFSYDEIPVLCNTLPALELCYSMSQKFLDDQQKSPDNRSPAVADQSASSPIANWKISSPGDHPEDVKARLKFWAHAVACTVKLCS